MAAVASVEVKNLHKNYILKGETVQALRGINLKVARGEYLSIMGPSGSGKTTLFNMVGGIDRPSEGKIIIEGTDVSKMSPKGMAWLRSRKIGYIFQTFNLIPVLTAMDNVALPMIFAGVPKDQRIKKATELLELVGLGDRLHHRPTELSGGQQQRVAIARALANDPAIILADEPTGNLDLNTGFAIVQLLYRLKVERGTTVICATHDLKMIDISDRVLFLRDGAIENIEKRRSLVLTADDVKKKMEAPAKAKTQCPCGRDIEKAEEYTMLYLKKELREIDVLCPNDACYLRELGYIRFDFENGKAKFKEATFYPPFVTWNAGRLGYEKAERLLKAHLKGLVTKKINWDKIVKPKTAE